MPEFAEAAREQLANYIEDNLGTHLTAVETAESLTANSLGRPAVVLRGANPSDTRYPRVEVEVLESGPPQFGDTSIFVYQLEVTFLLRSTDALVLPLQEKLLRWESAWWRLMSRGASDLGGIANVNAALCGRVAKDYAEAPAGGHLAIAVAEVEIHRQEA